VRDRVEITDAEALFGQGLRAFWFTSADEGCAGCEVFQRGDESAGPVCRVTFWDAVGQYFVELPKGELKAETLLRIVTKTVERVGVPLTELAR
jgi:hypothetical protein